MKQAYTIYKNEKGHYILNYCDQNMMIYKANTTEAYTRWMGMHLKLGEEMLYTLREVQRTNVSTSGEIEI